MIVFCRILAVAAVAAVLAAPARADVTYAKDVAPILNKACSECHRPGEAVPMSLLTYDDVRPWVKSIKKVVSEKTMPPWHADPSIGHWSNDRTMAPADIAKVVAWVDAGAPMGDAKDLPPPVPFVEGWKIGKPDAIFEATEEVELPADLEDEYIYVKIKTGFTEDRWLKAIECRPGNIEVVHHIIAFAKPPGNNAAPEHSKEAGEAANKEGGRKRERKGRRGPLGGGLVGLGGMAPGTAPMVCKPGEGVLLPANSDIIFQMHYHKEKGKAAKDRSKIGMIFCDYPVVKQKHSDAASNFIFVIPPRAENHEVMGVLTVEDDMDLETVMPHMHLRGKSMKVWAKLPDNTEKDILNVPRYDFNWQTIYQAAEPIRIPKGTKIYAKAVYDNSEKNPANPNPDEAVRFGEPTTAEMMFAFLSFTLPTENLNAVDPSYKPAGGVGQ